MRHRRCNALRPGRGRGSGQGKGVSPLRHRSGRSWAAALLAAAAVAFGPSARATDSRSAEPPNAVPRPAGLALPPSIGVLDYMGERSRADSRPGESYSYRAAGLGLDIDVYDLDSARLPDGIASALLGREYARMQQPLRGGGARLIRDGTVSLGAGGSRPGIPAREAVFARRGAPDRGTSYLWIAARGGRLYEMRFEVRAGFEDDGAVSRSEALAALGEAIARSAAAPSAGSAPQIGVEMLWDPRTPPRERPLWTAYLYTRAALVAAQSEDVPFAPGEHAASFEEELRARLIAVNLFRQLRRRDRSLESAYFADLDRVEAAGFLREYLWRYLRNPSWSEPDGLKLAEFDAWRTTHLRQHRPVTHGRIAVRLAASPVGEGPASRAH